MTCEDCGAANARKHLDAADIEHWFCDACFRDLCDWLPMRGKYAPKKTT